MGTAVRAAPTHAAARRPRGFATTDAINYLNVSLILLSFWVALYIPFQLFLFSYAILGPGHYLTEISWLQKRRFFTKGAYDAWVLAALAAIPSAFAIFTFGLCSNWARAKEWLSSSGSRSEQRLCFS